jgi:4-methyl-5(b-hydroxyethyl)-thiazole monophosphate biosynthesis
MEKKIAVLMAEGYEEGETVTIVDLLRRAGLTCHTFSFSGEYVKGMHGMMVKADKVFPDDIAFYDGIVLPGGRPGGANLKANPEVIKLVQQFNREKKMISAMCSGTLVLEEAGVIDGRKVTGYTGYEDKLQSGCFVHQPAVTDENLITSQGPATPYPFAFAIAAYFGKAQEVEILKDRLLYTFAGGK